MGVVVLWIVMGIVVGMIAHSKDQPAPLWFIYGAVIWPIALVHILLLKPATGSIAPAPPAIHAETPADRFLADDRPCPFCAETIKKAAKICRFCNREIEAMP